MAQTRLCARYQDLLRHRKKTVVVVTAIGRELVGFLWAITRAIHAPGITAAEALQRKATEALKQETHTPAARAGRTYTLDAGKKYQATQPAVGQQVLQTRAGKALRKKKQNTAAR